MELPPYGCSGGGSWDPQCGDEVACWGEGSQRSKCSPKMELSQKLKGLDSYMEYTIIINKFEQALSILLIYQDLFRPTFYARLSHKRLDIDYLLAITDMEKEQLCEDGVVEERRVGEEKGVEVVLETSDPEQNTKKESAVQIHDEESNTLMPTSKHQPVRRYGNYVTFIDKPYLTITFGPDYLCFLPTFIIFTVFAFLLMKFINTNSTNVYFIIITNIICIGQPLSYLLVAISDPGIAHPLSESDKLKYSKTMYGIVRPSFCRKCRFDVPQKTFHCTYCDVCIEGYDHHCPWTSKCIGRNNLIKFYIFLFWTPVFIVYSAFAFGFTVDDVASKDTHLRRFGN